ncbi:MAG: GTP cyclohydrolase, FolE2/MptA family, partial [Candidatus Thorarchaeota archaeon]
MVVDTQNEKPRHRIQLNKVGVKDLKTFLITERSGLRHHLIPRVEFTIDLPADLKGVHMSRLVESMTEVISEEFSVYKSVEELQNRILDALSAKHGFKRGEIIFDFEFSYASKTPASKKRTWEVCDITASTVKEEGKPNINCAEVRV